MKLLFLVSLLFALLAVPAAAQERPPEGDPRFPAPEFPTGVDWLNVTEPLTMAALRGKVVLLDFWTYGCINCIHMIPVLKQLEAQYGDALAVVGVHSAKFDNEGQTDNIRQIVQRYGIAHPVINDSAFTVWGAYGRFGVNAWPTFVVIDPRGNLFAVQAGEIPFESFDRVIGAIVNHFEALGELDRTPLPTVVEGADAPATLLRFPGKLLADAQGGRLFITDTGNNRIVIADLTTFEVLDVIGSGQQGLIDGGYSEAAFNQPHGLALRDGLLIVADTNNHAVRAVDLAARSVTTIAGTGQQGYIREGVHNAREVDLASPWDVTFGDEGELYVAMAGTHQIWGFSLDGGLIGPIIGNGREALLEGLLADAELAQPSGLYYRDPILFWADSESSSIRSADFISGYTRTVAGPVINDLFTYGDVDGGVGDSRLQHPLALVGDDDGAIWVADTYNHKIKRLEPRERQIVSVYGLGGLGGFADGRPDVAQFDEPGGLAYADGLLYVADTNNHTVRIIDLATQQVSTLAFPNPAALQQADALTIIGASGAGEVVALEAQTVAPGEGAVTLTLTLPEGYKLNPLIDSTVEWTSSAAAVAPSAASSPVDDTLTVALPAAFSAGEATLTAALNLYYCEAVNETLCFIERAQLALPVTVAEGASGAALSLTRRVTPPQTATGGLGG